MEKITKLRSAFDEAGIDGILLTNEYSRRYMTGFTGTAGVVLISKERALFITDFRYVEQASKQAVGYEIVQHTGPILDEVANQVNNLGIQKLGFEQDTLTYSSYTAHKEAIAAEFIPTSGLVEKLRLIKTDSEIKILKEAAQIADAAFEHILSFIHPGVSEIEVSNELEFFMRKQGATSSSFDIIVASGLRSALPHGVASEKVIETGDFVTLDFGAYYKGYCSDITRTIAVGEPSDKLKEIYHVVLEAQLRGVNGMKAGLTGREADALTRDYIAEKGYGEYFGHSTGHGLGLEVHEAPGLAYRSETVLEPGMVVTVEPGIYIPGVGGVRIEDDIIVTSEGNEVITKSPKELIIL
ncbi:MULTISPECIES: Xaa-Pro dipeptidase [Bacillus cereus group]|uniref:Xaa-Pro dipeptidase n=1 Tax=Bacillus cereus group TaxID=86661 RepID=UPI0008642E17|nr:MULTISPECIES: Xaa-Pro peptidase family protein [Bacillus cereus group]AWC29775.1 aminopeptidase P family protein [Bacillus cytotoxicus]AWC41906.1 aminopeptidase P family protein [Bacillus cytotoxicus]AWC49837.1 aminopeptidase P family protein [Bacillus cytotoxicus]AWC53852.1 aminopeptidase P family protein [Bacillus cytotoxicus]AWC57978.1 aminopeptidase P family protein [Bacillus cytotoxicus]